MSVLKFAVRETLSPHLRRNCHPEEASALRMACFTIVMHVSISERQHICLQRGTNATKDASTPLRMTCVSTNTDRCQAWFSFSQSNPYKIAN